jgi:hypothetical protein
MSHLSQWLSLLRDGCIWERLAKNNKIIGWANLVVGLGLVVKGSGLHSLAEAYTLGGPENKTLLFKMMHEWQTQDLHMWWFRKIFPVKNKLEKIVKLLMNWEIVHNLIPCCTTQKGLFTWTVIFVLLRVARRHATRWKLILTVCRTAWCDSERQKNMFMETDLRKS